MPTTAASPDLPQDPTNEFCDNPNCISRGVKDVPVSVNGPGDQQRTLCAVCEEAYTWGIQHGQFTAEGEPVFIAVVTDRGMVAYARAFRSRTEAEDALITYLTDHHGYKGGHELHLAYEWVGEQAYLTAEIIDQDALAEG